jgi:hypothetical protein
MIEKEIKRNQPAAKLLRQFCDKASGKVSTSRKELQHRFDGLDWAIQKKFLEASIRSGLSDREWALKKLYKMWDKSFIPIVQEYWEQYHEDSATWIVIKHFPTDFLEANMDRLLGGRNYFFICMRLGHKKDFVVDKEKLTPFDYLYVMYTLGRKMSDEGAMECIYLTARQVAEDEDGYWLNRPRHESRYSVASPIIFRNLYMAEFYIREMGLTKASDEFNGWRRKVADDVERSEAYRTLEDSNCHDEEYNEALFNLVAKSVLQCLPDDYRHDHLKEMTAKNEALNILVEKLSLKETT